MKGDGTFRSNFALAFTFILRSISSSGAGERKRERGLGLESENMRIGLHCSQVSALYWFLSINVDAVPLQFYYGWTDFSTGQIEGSRIYIEHLAMNKVKKNPIVY